MNAKQGEECRRLILAQAAALDGARLIKALTRVVGPIALPAPRRR